MPYHFALHSILCSYTSMDTELFQKWQIQLRKGYLELCVLAFLNSHKKAYGLQLLQKLEASGLDVNEGTLYPLLNRMQKNGWLESVWETPGSTGHPRRFYHLTKHSQALLPQMLEAYEQNNQVVAALLEKPHE